MANRMVRALLRSPLKGVLRGVCELGYVGRRTGRTLGLPVAFACEQDRLVVYVGHSAGKLWWRNFVEPWPVSARIDGVDRPGTGRVVLSTDPDRAQAVGIYRRRRPRAEVADEPVVVIDLAPTG